MIVESMIDGVKERVREIATKQCSEMEKKEEPIN